MVYSRNHFIYINSSRPEALGDVEDPSDSDYDEHLHDLDSSDSDLDMDDWDDPLDDDDDQD